MGAQFGQICGLGVKQGQNKWFGFEKILGGQGGQKGGRSQNVEILVKMCILGVNMMFGEKI